jgi:hypothetical protein
MSELPPPPPECPEADCEPREREDPRRDSASRALVRYVVRPSMLSRWGYALDFTGRGVAFLAAEPVGCDAVLALRLEDGPPGSSVIRTGRVTHCGRVDGGWRVGCAVSPPFSPAELAALA